jgi:hypothetical protein
LKILKILNRFSHPIILKIHALIKISKIHQMYKSSRTKIILIRKIISSNNWLMKYKYLITRFKALILLMNKLIKIKKNNCRFLTTLNLIECFLKEKNDTYEQKLNKSKILFFYSNLLFKFSLI